MYRATYVINAVGLLSAINFPNLPGLDTFEGETIHTAAWPEGKDLAGRRVGVIGTGSTGQQVITALAPEVEHLTVFVRTPQYSVPVGKRPVTTQQIDAVKADYDQIWAQVKGSAVAFGFEESTVPAMSVSEEERRRVFEEAWQHGGGFRFMFGTFGDIATDEEANEAAASFIRSKIAEIIEDPETARKLMPTGLFAKRPLCDDGYLQVFNRPNVEAVAIKENPIREVTAKGVVTEDGVLHELDVLVFATGFDAVDGNYRRIEIRGRDGLNINDHWDGQPTSYLGVTTANFPNWFMVLGPNGPFTNLPPSIETQVEWISDTIDYAERNGVQSIEPTPEAEAEWTETCTTDGQRDVVHQGRTRGSSARTSPGKKPSVLVLPGRPRQLPRRPGRRHGRRIPRLRGEVGRHGRRLTTARRPSSHLRNRRTTHGCVQHHRPGHRGTVAQYQELSDAELDVSSDAARRRTAPGGPRRWSSAEPF